MEWRYYEWEDRLYRAPRQAPGRMELLNPVTREWERYRGDAARVLVESVVLNAPPKNVP